MNAFETKNSVLSSVVPVIKKFDPGPPEKCANKSYCQVLLCK